MSITTEKERAQSERFLLVRVNPARFITPVINAGLYEITLPFIVSKLQRNGVDLVKDTSAPVTNDHWFQNETTKLLQVKLASAPNSTSNILIAFHYLFYTATIFRAISEDPEDSLTTTREWSPKIQTYPSIFQSFDNVFYGVFSINDASIDIINEDQGLQEFLTEDDSFHNKTVEIWMCINTVSNIEKIFTGVIKSIRLTTNIFTLNCVDSFNKLKDKASMGDSQDEIYYSATGFPNIAAKSKDSPVPFIAGPSSRYLTKLIQPFAGGPPDAYVMDKGNEAADIFKEEISITTNRIWGLCRLPNTVNTQSLGTIDAFTPAFPGYIFIHLTSYSNLYVGDTLKWTTAAVDGYGIVAALGSFTYPGGPFNIIVKTMFGSTINLTSTFTNLPSIAISVFDPTIGATKNVVYEHDYTVDDTTATSGGNRFVKITFVNNVETFYGFSDLDPDKHTIYYRVSNSEVWSHADFIQEVCGHIGLTTEATSFSDAETDLPVNVQFAIPNFDEIDYDTYLKYVQDVLSSALSYLKINTSFEVEYHLIEAPISSDVRDNKLMLADGTEGSVEYQDLQTTIIAYNPHNSSFQITQATPTPSETRSSTKSRYLNELENVTRFRHVLETITSRIDTHIGFKSTRFTKYKFQTATQDIDSGLGDDLELQNKIVCGSSDTQDVKIITIEKSPKLTSIEASDFKGV